MRFILAVLTLIACCHRPLDVYGQSAEPTRADSLRGAAAGRFEIGVGINDRIPEQKENWPLLKQQFSIITPENCMKPQSIQRTLGAFDFQVPDRFVEFAVTHDLRIVGHCLVWAKDDRTYDWYYKEGDRALNGQELNARMRSDIHKLVSRYRGKIAMWDVVNEALDDGEEYLRPSGWVSACGETFIAEAFRAAHEADPEALLIYNDYNNELPKKREKMLRLIRSLQEQNVPLHAIGLQGHYEIDRIPFDEIEQTIVDVRKLGLKVVVSELDIDVIPRGRWWAENGKYREELATLDPYPNGLPDDLQQRLAEQYAKLFSIFAKHSDAILRVSFWNLHDGESWLNYFPWKRVNHPLLFDRDRLPKPAYDAVLKALATRS
ncbi:MAG: endo-1,4-beta-xylanase [Pirellula sp.]|jgi:endo-1,4-beta-xylanase|nr:endo-1,4-beta-xylanase [Pirellula sp.]